ncbi:hypothetical protein HanLR1_Chr08g0272151 [Helianthus annuus]|nr:hypothetical protein HanHA89_Chr08g0290291 [Helianthus annuus]KAJ0718577.1 hypothetical protein HanLR1_Chr08g0272151 [Helianthus annuus]
MLVSGLVKEFEGGWKGCMSKENEDSFGIKARNLGWTGTFVLKMWENMTMVHPSFFTHPAKSGYFFIP